MTEVQFPANEGPSLFPRGDNYEIVEYILNEILKSSYPEPLGQFQPNLAPSILEGNSCLFKWRTIKFSKSRQWVFSSLNQRYDLHVIMCVYWLNYFPKWAMWPMGLFFIINYLYGLFFFIFVILRTDYIYFTW